MSQRASGLSFLRLAPILLLSSGCAAVIGAGTFAGIALTSNNTKTIPPAPEPINVLTPPTTAFDRVPLSYTLSGTSGTTFDLEVEYSLSGTAGPFAPATEALGTPSQGTSGLRAEPNGAPHVFVWNSFFDLDSQNIVTNATVVVRMTALVAPVTTGQTPQAYGKPGLTGTFTVDNRLCTTVAGTAAAGGEGVLGLDTPLFQPEAAVVISGGSMIVSDTGSARLRIYDFPTKLVTTFAGSSVAGFFGDGDLAQVAQIAAPHGIAVDANQDIFFADTFNQRVRRVDGTTHVITTIAGVGSAGYSGDNGPATSAMLQNPDGVAVDSQGNVYVADSGNHAIRVIAPGGAIETVCGNGSPGSAGDGGPARSAQLSSPSQVFIDPASGSIYVADSGNHAIRAFTPGGTIATVAGTLGTAGIGGEGVPATSSALTSPLGVCVVAGDVLVADTGNNRVRRFKLGAEITTIAGAIDGTAGFAGDTGLSTGALLSGPAHLDPDGSGGFIVADAGNNRIRQVDASGTITTVIGSGAPDSTFVGDGGPALQATIAVPFAVRVGPDGAFYFADTSQNRVRKFRVGGSITAIAGTGGVGPTKGDGGPALQATFNFPVDVEVDANGIIFVSDEGNTCIRAINPTTNVITTVAGGGPTTADGPALQTQFLNPGVMNCLPSSQPNQLLILDTIANTIRRLTYQTDGVGNVTSGSVDTVAGTGTAGNGTLVDGQLATQTNLAGLQDLVNDGQNPATIYYIEYQGVVRKFQIGGTITTVAGNPGSQAASGDGGLAINATFSVNSLAYDTSKGFIYGTDAVNNRVFRFQDGGTIETVAGNGQVGEPTLGVAATQTAIPGPVGVTLDPATGGVVVGSDATHRFYEFTVGGNLDAVAGRDVFGAFPGDGGPAVAGVIQEPLAIVNPGDGAVFVVQQDFGRLLRVDKQTGLISNVVGRGIDTLSNVPGPLEQAFLSKEPGLAVDASGNIYLPSQNEAVILKVDRTHDQISIFAGNRGVLNAGGDGGPASSATFSLLNGIAISPVTGNLYITDVGSGTIRRINAASTIIDTIAGGGSDQTSDNIPALQAGLSLAIDIAVDRNETIYICQTTPLSNVRKFTIGGNITTVAGIANSPGYNGDGILATMAQLNAPNGVAVDDKGQVYIADLGNYRVRKVDTQGFITTAIGTGESGSGPDGVPAQLSRINGPFHVWVDGHGYIYVSEFYGRRVRRFREFP